MNAQEPGNAGRRRVSVCMATYNGAKYIEEQLGSILAQLRPDDEVVIVDDASRDETVALIRALHDPRIILHLHAENRGYVRTFEDALSHASADVILLSDQDDVWAPGRRDALVAATDHSAVVASNLDLHGSGAPLPHPLTRRPWLLKSRTSTQRSRNLLRVLGGVSPYFGCAMAVRRDFVARIMPFPPFLFESHDLWIALAAIDAREMLHLERVTVHRRLHDSNASPSRPRGVRSVLRARVMLVQSWREAGRRRRTARRSG